jgi:plasmid maintenance system killer protein
MDILFKTKKLSKMFNSQDLLVRAQGPKRAALIRRRLDDLRAAGTLQEISHLPPVRCHELTGDRAGQLSVDLDHPYRLVFCVANNPVPRKPDGGIRSDPGDGH